MKINLNDTIRGYLSETGARILNERDQRTADDSTMTPAVRRFARERLGRRAGDLYTGQVWSMMDDFGNAMLLGGILPFINGEIEIVTPDVRKADADRELKRRMYRV